MKNITFFKHLLMLAAIVFAASCSSPEEFIPAVDNSKDLKIKYEITGAKVEVLSRTVGTHNENMVNTIHTLFFNPTSHEFVGLTASGVTDDASTGTGSAIVTMPVGTDVDDHYELLFLANYSTYADLTGSGTSNVDTYLYNLLNGKTLTQAQNAIIGWASQAAGLKTPLLMSFYLDKLAGTNIANVKFQRSVARIDLINATVGTAFELVSAEIWNARKSTTVADAGSITTGASGDYTNYTGGKVTVTPGYRLITGQLYAFENSVLTPTQKDNQTTCLIIGARYNYSPTVTYYRVNVCAANAQQLLKRNHLYTINITSVTAPGKEDQNGALNDFDLNVKYTINDWADNFNTTYVYDQDGNGLAVSQRFATFGDKGGLSAEIEVFKIVSGRNPIFSNWTVEPIAGTDASEFTAVEKATDLQKYITISSLTDNLGSASRTANFNVVWGGIKIPITIAQSSASSSLTGIKCVPSSLMFSKAGETIEVGVDMQGNFSGITSADIKTEIQYVNGTGWLTAVFNRIDASGIAIFKVTAPAITGNVVLTRDANIKFSITQGLSVMTCKAFIRQSTVVTEESQIARTFSMNVYRKNIPVPIVPADYDYLGLAGPNAAYKNFKGFPAGLATDGNIHLAINDKDEMQYRITIQSTMPWKIVPDDVVYKYVNFSMMQSAGSADVGVSDVVTIMAKMDAVSDAAFMLTGWTGSFDVVFENGDKRTYYVHQRGCLKTFNHPAGVSTAAGYNNGAVFYYGTVMMFGKLWLDRNIGVPTTSDFDETTNPSTYIISGNTQGDYYTLAQATNNMCPAGFRVPTVEEWALLAPSAVAVTKMNGATNYSVTSIQYSVSPELYWRIPGGVWSATVPTFYLASTINKYFMVNAKYFAPFWAGASYKYNAVKCTPYTAYAGGLASSGSFVAQTDAQEGYIPAGYTTTTDARVLRHAAAANVTYNNTQVAGHSRGLLRCVKN